MPTLAEELAAIAVRAQAVIDIRERTRVYEPSSEEISDLARQFFVILADEMRALAETGQRRTTFDLSENSRYPKALRRKFLPYALILRENAITELADKLSTILQEQGFKTREHLRSHRILVVEW